MQQWVDTGWCCMIEKMVVTGSCCMKSRKKYGRLFLYVSFDKHSIVILLIACDFSCRLSFFIFSHGFKNLCIDVISEWTWKSSNMAFIENLFVLSYSQCINRTSHLFALYNQLICLICFVTLSVTDIVKTRRKIGEVTLKVKRARIR